jgi:hypothetical protein
MAKILLYAERQIDSIQMGHAIDDYTNAIRKENPEKPPQKPEKPKCKSCNGTGTIGGVFGAIVCPCTWLNVMAE